MKRMRTAAGVFEIIKAEDPGTDVTMNYIKTLFRSGEIPVTKVGRKRLADADLVMEHIAAGTASEPETVVPFSRMRRVPV